MNSASTVTLTLVDGVKVVVPNSLNLITPYVILEQADWFEDEIKFVRKLLQPGNRVIDIGANYGVFTLSMAKAVGDTGKIWAFEPASKTAVLLTASIAENAFSQVCLLRCALSDHQGTARFANNEHAETNALLDEGTPSQASEEVQLDTLDHCMTRHAWENIDFIKMDAEGAEISIIHGGRQFLASRSPLIQYEIKAGTSLNLTLVTAFSALGYQSYRLVPGLDVLIPFDATKEIDGYLLNLYCCKRDTAIKLAERGLLLDEADGEERSLDNELTELTKLIGQHGWRTSLRELPYEKKLEAVWEETIAANQSSAVEDAVALHSISRNNSLPMKTRWQALNASLHRLKDLCAEDDRNLRLATLAKVARDHGARLVAVNALNQLVTRTFQQGGMNLTEPFLMPCNRFEALMPDDALRIWTVCGLLEEFETLASFSSFYTPEQSLARLKIMQQLEFFGAKMKRRFDLIESRSLAPAATGDSSIPEKFLTADPLP